MQVPEVLLLYLLIIRWLTIERTFSFSSVWKRFTLQLKCLWNDRDFFEGYFVCMQMQTRLTTDNDCQLQFTPSISCSGELLRYLTSWNIPTFHNSWIDFMSTHYSIFYSKTVVQNPVQLFQVQKYRQNKIWFLDGKNRCLSELT